MSQKLKTTPKPSPKNTLFNYFAKSSSNTPKNDEKSADKKVTAMDVDEDQENQKNNKNLQGKKLDFGEFRSMMLKFSSNKL